MPLAQATVQTTEQELEARLRGAILKALPWLPAEALKHQLTFTFKFGRATVTVNGRSQSDAGARLDVLVTLHGRPLAIFELKRPGERLTADDGAQALSYARLMFPSPPLVILSNGETSRLLETHTGLAWAPKTPDEKALAALISNAGKLAEAEVKRAVETLMAADRTVWMTAVRLATEEAIAEMTGEWGDTTSTFNKEWGLPRVATAHVIAALEAGRRLVFVEGEPLAGKSHVLRDLSIDLADSDEFAVLYFQADGGADLFQRLADLLSDLLDWHMTSHEAREWLRLRSRSRSPQTLVLVLDHVGRGEGDLRKDIEALTSNAFGPGVRVVLGLDDGAADALLTKAVGRGPSALAPRATRISVGSLSEQEFGQALETLREDRIGFLAGARHSPDLRHPWVLAEMVSDVHEDDNRGDVSLSAALPPQAGLDFLQRVRARGQAAQGPLAFYRELAAGLLDDLESAASPEQVLHLVGGYVVRKDTARKRLGETDLSDLEEAGLVSLTRTEAGENVYAVRLPHMLASELARLLAERLTAEPHGDIADKIDRLLRVAGGLFLGDVIAAQALIDVAIRQSATGLNLISGLAELAPVRETLAPGSRVAGWMDGLGVVNMTLLEAGAVQFEKDGATLIAEAEPGEPRDHTAWRDYLPWLVLSRVAGFPFEVVDNGQILGRGDVALLLEIGTCPTVLVEANGDVEIRGLPTHQFGPDLSVVCWKAGLVEPVSWSLFSFLSREWASNGGPFIEAAVETGSPALLARLDLCLRIIRGLAKDDRARWAESQLARIAPLLDEALPGAAHD